MIQMSGREKIYVIVGGSFLGLAVLWFLLINPYFNGIAGAKARIEKGRADLETMIDLYKTQASVQAQLRELEAKIPTDEEFSILSNLEKLASDAGISDTIDKMQERNKPSNAYYMESSVEVSLKSVPLDSLIDYLHRIESSPNLMKVDELNLNVRYGNRSLLDAKIEVSSFQYL